MCPHIETHQKIHVLGNFGDMRISISENFQKIDFSSIFPKNIFPKNFSKTYGIKFQQMLIL